MPSKEERISNLKNARLKLQASNEAKVVAALDDAMRRSEKISIAALAEKSGVSRATIYRNEKLRKVIDNYRETSILRRNRKSKTEKEAQIEASYKAKTAALKERLKKVETENASLKNELTKLREYIDSLM